MRFLLIDRIKSWHPGRTATAVKNVALSEDFFDDHFPLKPIMPGVLITEGMAQLAGLLIEEGVRRDTGRRVKAIMSIIRQAKFRKPVHPGDSIEYRATVQSVNEAGAVAEVEARVGAETVAESVLVFALQDVPLEQLERRRSEILSFWLEGCDTHDAP